MNAKEILRAWECIVSIYDETRYHSTPVQTTINLIVHDLGGIDQAKEVFATVSAIKKHDGRISSANRTYMQSIPVDPVLASCSGDNPIICPKLDHIHTSHIDQLITALRELEGKDTD